jgi:hypothetical protein
MSLKFGFRKVSTMQSDSAFEQLQLCACTASPKVVGWWLLGWSLKGKEEPGKRHWQQPYTGTNHEIRRFMA